MGISFRSAPSLRLQPVLLMASIAGACPPGSAGTIFALLMSLTNLSTSLATYCGGQAYEVFEATAGSSRVAFLGLIVIGSLATAACWVLVPFMRRAAIQRPM